MPLPIGTWKITVNGAEGALEINEAGGLVTGLLMTEAIDGSWNETAQCLSFVSLAQLSATAFQFRGFYVGYLFSTPRAVQPGQDILWTLCGVVHATPQVESPAYGQAHPLRNVFGWHAQRGQVL